MMTLAAGMMRDGAADLSARDRLGIGGGSMVLVKQLRTGSSVLDPRKGFRRGEWRRGHQNNAAPGQ